VEAVLRIVVADCGVAVGSGVGEAVGVGGGVEVGSGVVVGVAVDVTARVAAGDGSDCSPHAAPTTANKVIRRTT